MKDFYKDSAYSGIQYMGLAHRYGVNGKTAGSLAALSEIEGCAVILHGPVGCAYHYRYSMRSRFKPVYDLQSTELKNRDIVFGGTDKLEQALLDTLAKKPEMVAILPTCVSDIMGDDLQGIVNDFIKKHAVKTPIVVVLSDVFSHPDKVSSLKRLKERAWSGCARNAPSTAQFKGCGFIEVLCALVDQIMEPQQVLSGTVNIESFAWGYGGTDKMQAVVNLLNDMDIKVNTLIPSANCQQLREAPKAELNIVRRIRWAQKMQASFGTKYIHFPNLNEWTGFEGIGDFYLRIADKLGKTRQAKNVLHKEQNKYFHEINEIKSYLRKHRYGLVTSALNNIPEQIQLYEQEYDMPLSFVCLLLPGSYQADAKIDDATMEKMLSNVKEALANTGSKAVFAINPNQKELANMAKDIDFLIGDSLLRFKQLSAPILTDIAEFRPLDFAGYKEVLKNIAGAVDKKQISTDLLLHLLDYSLEYYPLLDDINTLSSREMWQEMWRRK